MTKTSSGELVFGPCSVLPCVLACGQISAGAGCLTKQSEIYLTRSIHFVRCFRNLFNFTNIKKLKYTNKWETNIKVVMYQQINIGPLDRGQSLAEEFWCWEPRTQTDLLFQCPDGFIRSHKLLLRSCSRTIARAMAGKTLKMCQYRPFLNDSFNLHLYDTYH